MTNIVFDILLTVSRGVYGSEGYDNYECAFCGCEQGDAHSEKCETVLALQAMKEQYSELYQQHLDVIELAKLRQRERSRQYKLKLEQEHAKNYVVCEKCSVEVRRADYVMHVDHKRCLSNQKRNQAQVEQVRRQEMHLQALIMLERIEQL